MRRREAASLRESGGAAKTALARGRAGEFLLNASSFCVEAKALGRWGATDQSSTNNGADHNTYWREVLWDTERFTQRGEDPSLPQDLGNKEFFRSKISFSLGGRTCKLTLQGCPSAAVSPSPEVLTGLKTPETLHLCPACAW